MSSPPTVVCRTTDHLFGLWEDFFVTVWIQKTSLAGVQTGDRIFQEHCRGRSKHVALITIVEENASMPPGSARDALADFLKSGSDIIVASALVHEGTGFRSAAVRTTVTGLTLLARQPFPHKVHATVEDAAHWIAPHMPTPLRPGDLIHAIQVLRAG